MLYCSWHCQQALQRNLGSYGKKRIEDGKPMPDILTVDCRCQHIFHRNLHGDFLTDEHRAEFRSMFEECGLDVYNSRMRAAKEREEDPLEIEEDGQRLQFLRRHGGAPRAVVRA